MGTVQQQPERLQQCQQRERLSRGLEQRALRLARARHRWLMMESLPLRLMAFILIPVIAITVVVGLWALGSMEDHLEHRLQREVEMVARALQLPLGEALHGQGPEGVKPALDSAFAIRRVYGAYVYDQGGHLVASSAAREPSGSSLGISDVIAEGGRTGQYDEVDGRQVYSYFVPLNGAGGEMIGVLRITRKQSNLAEYVDALREKGLLLVSLTTLVLMAVVLLGYYVAVGRSLRSFARSIHRVGAGERGHRVEVRSPREIASLAQLFNRMLDSLNDAEQRAASEHQTRQTIEEQLRHAERLATIGCVTAGVAHELGTPLSTVGGHAQRVLRRNDLEPAVRQSLEAVRGQAARMERLVRQLLDYGAKQTPSRMCTEARMLVVAAANAMAPLVEKTQVCLRVLDTEHRKVEVDPVRLEQALINLIRNALQAARRRVDVQCRSEGESFLFIVDDDGPGVSSEIRSRLYEPFVTDKQASGGTGLGLAICSTVAQEHGGTVYDTRSPLGGARFVLRISHIPGQVTSLGAA